MNSNFKVSVILSVYNSENTIKKSIESLVNQTYKDIEILIIDDNSTDKTFELCKEYEKKHNNISLFKNNKNIGLTKNLNYLIGKSTGSYIARQDADDISELDRIEKQMKFIDTTSVDGCTTRAFIMKENKITPNKSIYFPKKIVMRFKNPFIHGSLTIKRSTIEKIGNYNENFYYSQDYKLMHDLIHNGYKIKILKEPLYHLNMEGNISVEKKDQQKYYADCVRKNLAPDYIK